MKRKVVSFWFAIVCLVFSVWNGSSQGLITPPSTITALTHEITAGSPFGPPASIRDYAASDQFVQTGFTTTLTGSELVVGSFEASAGQMFVIHSSPSGGNIFLQMHSSWIAGSGGGVSFNPTSLDVVFLNLVGETPLLSLATSSISQGTILFNTSFTVAAGTSFTGVQISAQYASTIPSPVEQLYTPNGFTFSASASYSPTTGDGILMSLEPIPEPSVLALIFLGSGVLIFATKRRPLRKN
mgnify:CR=1 FL=1